MSRHASLVFMWTGALLALVPPVSAAAADDAAAARLAEENAYCADDLRMVENRRKLFAAQGLSAAEISSRNAQAEQAVAECRRKFKREKQAELDYAADEKEAIERAGPKATAEQRMKAWKAVRRERLAARSPSELTPEERTELAAGEGEEMKATHKAMDVAHANDPAFMRYSHSALACYHGSRQRRLAAQISEEENLLKLGTGDRQRYYTLVSDKKTSDGVLQQVEAAAARYPGGLIRCEDRKIAVLAHCLAIRLEGGKRQPSCEAEEIQQYLRLVR
ncbi:MAG: hypothetical protein WCC48_09955 [Anaeromyxobacteraceae bacterium]